MHKRALCRRAVSVRPSVHLSVCVVTFVYYVETKLLPPTKVQVNALARVCLSASKIRPTQKRVHEFG